MSRRIKSSDFEVSQRERELARKLGEGGAGAQSTGSTIGSLAGAGLGALGFLVPGAGLALGPALMSAGAGLGGQVGGMIGGKAAEGELEDAEDDLMDVDEERKRKLADYQLRQEALQGLLGTR
jgi:phage tail tape-measure protein